MALNAHITAPTRRTMFAAGALGAVAAVLPRRSEANGVRDDGALLELDRKRRDLLSRADATWNLHDEWEERGDLARRYECLEQACALDRAAYELRDQILLQEANSPAGILVKARLLFDLIDQDDVGAREALSNIVADLERQT